MVASGFCTVAFALLQQPRKEWPPYPPCWELFSQDFCPESGRMTWVGGIPSRTLSVSDTFGFSREVRYRGGSPDSLKLWRVSGGKEKAPGSCERPQLLLKHRLRGRYENCITNLSLRPDRLLFGGFIPAAPSCGLPRVPSPK